MIVFSLIIAPLINSYKYFPKIYCPKVTFRFYDYYRFGSIFFNNDEIYTIVDVAHVGNLMDVVLSAYDVELKI